MTGASDFGHAPKRTAPVGYLARRDADRTSPENFARGTDTRFNAALAPDARRAMGELARRCGRNDHASEKLRHLSSRTSSRPDGALGIQEVRGVRDVHDGCSRMRIPDQGTPLRRPFAQPRLGRNGLQLSTPAQLSPRLVRICSDFSSNCRRLHKHLRVGPNLPRPVDLHAGGSRHPGEQVDRGKSWTWKFHTILR